MMTLNQFICEHDVDFAAYLVNINFLKFAEEKLGVKFGKELNEYLMEYGYLGFESVELYGMNSRQQMDSDMIKQTLYLHQYFPITKSYIALENFGEGDYILVDENDNTFKFISENNQLIPCNLKLFAYILQRFQNELN